jgi:hypothetical protein
LPAKASRKLNSRAATRDDWLLSAFWLKLNKVCCLLSLSELCIHFYTPPNDVTDFKAVARLDPCNREVQQQLRRDNLVRSIYRIIQ